MLTRREGMITIQTVRQGIPVPLFSADGGAVTDFDEEDLPEAPEEDEYGDPNVSIFSQQGRLYGLKTTEDIIGYTTGNAYVVPNTTDLANMQNRFCMGAQGVFTVNGDWFYNESAKSTASTGNVIRWLRAPVTSYIVNKCSQVKDDTKLAFVIRAIDAEKDFAATAAEYATAGHGTLLEADYNIIKEARLVGGRGGGHCSYVCNGSDAEYVAMDFLRFLATDQGNKIVMDSTAGMVTPYIGGESTNYQVPEEDLETYAPFLQDRILEQQKVVVMPASESFKSVYKGSLYPWTTTVYPEIAFGASNPDDRKTAQQIYEEDIAYYTANENAFFETLKAQTGI